MSSTSNKELYEFQKEDVQKILRQRAGAIGSEMGTGKTLEAIELMEQWAEDHPHLPDLVVAPLNTFDGWLARFSEMYPKTDITVIDRKNRPKFVQALEKKQGDVFLMHWDALRLMPELRKMKFGTIVADEAHRAANRKAQQTRALKGLRTEHKLAMSGTLSGDAPQNLWSVFNWLWPKVYTSYWRFFNHYCETEIVYPEGYHKIIGVKNVKGLHEEIRPWYVRHLKREQCCLRHPGGVMPWLPEKTYDTVWVELTPAQRRVYEQMRKNMVAWVNEHEDTPLMASVVVAQMTRLSQMALAMPEMVGNEVHLNLPSSKIDVTAELFRDHSEKQFVVFTSSRKMAYLAQEAYKSKGISSVVLSGDTPQSEREGMVGRFAKGSAQLFIAVIQAGGEGIDGLQDATDTAVFLDRTWSARMNMQAEDRLHRGGQKNTVQIIDVMARNTVDLGRHQKLEQKWSWLKLLLDGKVAQT